MSANVSILGNLGRAPETQTTAEGMLVTKFSFASNSRQAHAARNGEKDRLVSRYRLRQTSRNVRQIREKRQPPARARQTDFEPVARPRRTRRKSARICCFKIFNSPAAAIIANRKKARAKSRLDPAEHSVETEIAGGDVQEIAQPNRSLLNRPP